MRQAHRTVVALSLLVGAAAAQCSRHHVHQALLDLMPPGAETHVAIRDGTWLDPRTWAGSAPRHGARVLIPAGIVVTVARQIPVRHAQVRIDGTLRFDPNANTRLMVGTIFSAPGGRFEMGTLAAPIAASRTAEVVILDEGPINLALDPGQVGRGLVLQGPTRIVGAERMPFAPVAGDYPAGSTSINLDLDRVGRTPLGWQVGDRVVLGGTHYDPAGLDTDDTRFHDEVLELTSIQQERIGFRNLGIRAGARNQLRFDHVRPRTEARWLLRNFIANLSRNAIVRSERGDSPIGHRGHVMLMHTTDVVLENAAFRDLGRSDKERNVDDPQVNVNGAPGSGSNPRGRYAVHFHRNLPADGRLPGGCVPARMRGCVVEGSPGWGIVHHDSHCIIEGNVVFDVKGSGIVAEAGNEIGAWRNNLVMKMRGLASRNQHLEINARLERYDFGFTGEGYWLQGAPRIDFENNVAMSCAGPGVVLFSFADAIGQQRDARTIHRDNLHPRLQHIVTNGDTIDSSHTPMERISGIEVINSHTGFLSWHHNRNDDGIDGFVCPCDRNDHRERTVVSGFIFWGLHGNGIFTQYTTQTDFEWGVVIGDPRNRVPVFLADDGAGRGHGISQNGPAQNLRYRYLWVEGFERAMRIPVEGNEVGPLRSRPFLRSELFLAHFQNCDYAFSRRNVPWVPAESFPDNFRVVGVTFSGLLPSAPPVASFRAESVGDEGVVRLDASTSYDPDPDPSLALSGQGIASYAWDTDGDGFDDHWGKTVHHHPGNFAPFNVRLTVLDHQGRKGQSKLQVLHAPSPYGELVIDGGFDLTGPYFPGWQLGTARAGDGWSVRDAHRDQGALRFAGQQFGVSGAAQIIFDDRVRRGRQTFSLNAQNIEGDAFANELRVEIWGVNGQFSGSAEGEGPFEIGAIPMQATLLHRQSLGGTNFGWTNFTTAVDFDAGYDHVYLQFRGRGIQSARGDVVRVDGVSITDG